MSAPTFHVGEDVRESLEDRLDDDQYTRLRDSGADPDAARALEDLDSVSAVRTVDGDLVVEGQKHGIDVELTHPDDGRAFYTRNSDDSMAEIRGRTPQQIGVDPVEEDIVPKLIDQREGWDVIYGKQKGGTEKGIDVIAKDGEEFVVTEVKFTTKREEIGRSRVSSTSREDPLTGSDVGQMENRWIQVSFEEDITPSDLDVDGEYDTLQTAIEDGNYRKEAFVVQDGTIGETVDTDLTNLGIERVDVVRTGQVTQE